MILPPPHSTLFPYTTLFRSGRQRGGHADVLVRRLGGRRPAHHALRRPVPPVAACGGHRPRRHHRDRKSTRLNSSHMSISYAVFCLKKKKQNTVTSTHVNNIV